MTHRPPLLQSAILTAEGNQEGHLIAVAPPAAAERTSFRLTDAQRAIVEHGEGPLVVIAGAGTGKTRVIVERVAHLLETDPELKPDGAILLSPRVSVADKLSAEIEYLTTEASAWTTSSRAFGSSGRGTTPIRIDPTEVSTSPRLRVCVDADVLFAGSASTSGASHVVLQLGELAIVDVRIADQARAETERNLADKLPSALAALRALVDACTSPIPVVAPTAARRLARTREADPKDAPILAAAIAAGCRWLLTFNVRDYRTERIRVSPPGPFLEELRAMLLAQGS